MNMAESVSKSLRPVSSLDCKMDRDQHEAAQLVTDYQKAGHRVKRVQIEPSPPSMSTGKQCAPLPVLLQKADFSVTVSLDLLVTATTVFCQASCILVMSRCSCHVWNVSALLTVTTQCRPALWKC